MTNKELAKRCEMRTPEQESAAHAKAVRDGVSFSGPGAIKKAVLATKTHKIIVTTRIDPDTILKIKEKADRVGIPYQTLINSVLKRYANGSLQIEIS